jgi:hypothetical protein
MENNILRSAILDATNENPAEMTDKIHNVLYSKVADALQTKKMEVSHNWLNNLETPEVEESEE